MNKKQSMGAAAMLGVAMITLSVDVLGAENAAEAYGPQLSELPDWTGVWGISGGIMFPTNEFVEYADDPLREEGGFSYGPIVGTTITGVPYNDEWQAKFDEITRQAREEKIINDHVAGCMLPHGMPRTMTSPTEMEWIVTPQQTTFILSYMNQVRRIYTDGRPHPPAELSWPTVMGHSIGHWEGQTLVVDTVNMRASTFDRSGAPHSDQVHLVERITKIDENTIESEMTVSDPVAFTEPWHVTRQYSKRGGTRIDVEGQYCQNQRNPIVDGNQTVVLPRDLQ